MIKYILYVHPKIFLLNILALSKIALIFASIKRTFKKTLLQIIILSYITIGYTTSSIFQNQIFQFLSANFFANNERWLIFVNSHFKLFLIIT